MSVTSGREALTRTDLVVPGVFPIELVRRYDSQSTFDSALGYGWAWSFDHRLFEYPDGSVVVRTSCGYKIRFVGSGGTFQVESNRQEALTDHGDGTYTLTYPRGRKVRFSNDGRVSALEDPSGNRLEMTYDAGGKQPLVGTSPYAVDPEVAMVVAQLPRLTKIAERLADGTLTGREVTFTYDSPDTGRLDSVSSYDSRSVTYVHDKEGTPQAAETNGNLVEVQGLEGVTETYGYADPNDDHNLTSIQVGPDLAPYILTYDDQDRVIEQSRGVGGDLKFEFDYSAPLTTVVSRTRITRDDQGTITNTEVALSTFEYDTRGLLERHVDPLGNEFHYIRDANGFLESLEVYHKQGPSLVLQKTTNHIYSLEGDLIEQSVTLDSGETVTKSWTYDQHWIASYQTVSDADPTKIFRTEYTFHRDGEGAPTNIHEIKRRRNDGSFDVTTLSYDTNGQLTAAVPPTVTPADGLTILRSYYTAADPQPGLLKEISLEVNSASDDHLKRSFEYDAQGLVSKVTDANGHETSFLWDDRGRLTRTTNDLGESTHYRYKGPSAGISFASAPAGGFLSELEIGETTADGEGQLRRFRYDAEGRMVEVERKDDAGSWSSFETHLYDSDDNRILVTDATGRETAFAYDLLGRLVSMTDDAPTPNVTTFAYDATGNRTSLTDAKSRVTNFLFDDLDRLISVTEAGRLVGQPPTSTSLTTAFAYDAAGNVAKVTDPKAQETTYAYDSRSRLTSITQEMLDTVSYAYDDRDRLVRTTNARGNVLVYGYEAWGGLSTADHYADTTAADAGPPSDRTVSYTYDDVGNLLTTSDTDWNPTTPLLYTYTYDELDRVNVVTTHYLPGGNRTLDSGYDRFGNRNDMVFTDGSDVLDHDWVFNDLDRLESATLAGGTVDFGYRANDELLSIDFPSGVETTLAYHPHGPIYTITVRDSSASLLHELEYDVDAVQNIDAITETRGAGSPESFAYEYDGLDRLVEASNPTTYGLPALEEYFYDAAGNREDRNSTTAYDYNDNNEIVDGPSGTSWTFDADGNVETKSGTADERFTFDRTNRLRAWEKGPSGSPTDTASFDYDPFGRRIRKIVNGVTTYFLWDGDTLLSEFDGTGTRQRRYLHAGGFAPLRVADPSGASEKVYDVHADHLDTPRMMTDDTENAVWQQGLEGFGTSQEITDPDGDTNYLKLQVRFPGQYDDETTGMHYNRSRYYSPLAGRYLAMDPVGQRGGLNTFEYAEGNPTSIDDPLGLCPGCQIGSVAGSAVAVRLYASSRANQLQRSGVFPPNPTPSLEPQSKSDYRHCLASCLLSKAHGSAAAKAAGDANEVFLGKGIGSLDNAIDQAANKFGRAVADSCPPGDCHQDCLAFSTSPKSGPVPRSSSRQVNFGLGAP